MNRSNEVLTIEPQLKVSLDVFKLIQPDLLTHEELIAVLQERGVEPSLLSQSKDNLVSLFKRVAYPLPQREFKNNHRGSLIMRQRQKANHITFNEPSSTDKQSSFTLGVAGNPAISKNSDGVKLSAERLKPPPDVINFERKTIKISTSKSSTVRLKRDTSSDLEKIVIKKRKTSDSSDDSARDKIETLEIGKISVGDTTEDNKVQKLDGGSENGSKQECNGLTRKPVPKKVSLKRNHISKAPSLSPEDKTSDKPALEPDKKRKPITWP